MPRTQAQRSEHTRAALRDAANRLFLKQGVDKTTVDGRLSWSATPGATAYDVVRGNLRTLAATGGDFSVSTDSCVGNDIATTESSDTSSPGAGEGFWYLVRAENCGGFGSFESGAPGQVTPRDPGIASSASHCP